MLEDERRDLEKKRNGRGPTRAKRLGTASIRHSSHNRVARLRPKQEEARIQVVEGRVPRRVTEQRERSDSFSDRRPLVKWLL